MKEKSAVMAGQSAKRVFALDVPAIHVIVGAKEVVDARVKPRA